MGIKLSALEPESPIVLKVSANERGLDIEGKIIQCLKDNVAIVELQVEQRLKFENVHIDVQYKPEGEEPIVWNGAKIVFYQGDYIMQVEGEGKPTNRREYFRIGVSKRASLKVDGQFRGDIIVRDVSITGFAVTDTTKELNLSIGTNLAVHFEDWGHILNLSGRIVRVQEEEDKTIYGLEITNICKDLASYIAVKQRNNRNK